MVLNHEGDTGLGTARLYFGYCVKWLCLCLCGGAGGDEGFEEVFFCYYAEWIFWGGWGGDEGEVGVCGAHYSYGTGEGVAGIDDCYGFLDGEFFKWYLFIIIGEVNDVESCYDSYYFACLVDKRVGGVVMGFYSHQELPGCFVYLD